jgi:hypothetical protein
MPGVSGVTVVTNARAFYTARAAAGASAPGIPCALYCERARNSGSNLAQTCGEIAKLRLQMILFEIDSVEWAKALAPCPPSIGNLILNGGHASTFALPPSLFELRRTGRATADAFAHPTQTAKDGDANTLVMPGLDPGIHPSSQESSFEGDGLPGQARQ